MRLLIAAILALIPPAAGAQEAGAPAQDPVAARIEALRNQRLGVQGPDGAGTPQAQGYQYDYGAGPEAQQFPNAESCVGCSDYNEYFLGRQAPPPQ